MTDYNPLASLRDFHNTFAPEQRKDSLFQKIERRGRLIEEEEQEVQEALDYLDRTDQGLTSSNNEEAMAEVAAELADLLYVVYGTAEELGIPLDRVFQEVHRANMDKVWDDGTIHRNDYGKVIKPPNHKKPDVASVLSGA